MPQPDELATITGASYLTISTTRALLNTTNTGSTVSNITGWKVGGVAVDAAAWTTGTNYVSIIASGLCDHGEPITYDGSGPMAVAAGGATIP